MIKPGPAALFALLALVACSKAPSNVTPPDPQSATASVEVQAPVAASANDTAWTANGASACEKYLTSSEKGALLVNPDGAAQKVSTHSCRDGDFFIELSISNMDWFKHRVAVTAAATRISDVGDGASIEPSGTFFAVKGNRACGVSFARGRDSTKSSGRALAEQVGAICNKLFALP